MKDTKSYWDTFWRSHAALLLILAMLPAVILVPGEWEKVVAVVILGLTSTALSLRSISISNASISRSEERIRKLDDRDQQYKIAKLMGTEREWLERIRAEDEAAERDKQ